MYPPRWFLPYDIVILLAITLISMAIAVFALRGYRWIKERSLYYLFLAFALLAIGFFAAGMTEGIDYLGPPYPRGFTGLTVTDVGGLVYYACSILAFVILAFAYFRTAREIAIAPALAALPIALPSYYPALEAVIIVLLFVIVFAQVVHLSVRKSRSAFAVLITFGMLLVSHALILVSSARSEDLYVAGMIVELAAFVFLLVLLLEWRKPR